MIIHFDKQAVVWRNIECFFLMAANIRTCHWNDLRHTHLNDLRTKKHLLISTLQKKKHHWFVDCKIEITFDLKILNFFLLFFLTYPHFSMQNCLLCKSLNRCNDTLAVSAKFSLYWNDVAFYSDWSNACTYYISEDCQQQIKLCCTSCEMYQLSTLDTVFQKIITKLFFSISLQFVAADDGERQSE